jgi:hypothetical protein
VDGWILYVFRILAEITSVVGNQKRMFVLNKIKEDSSTGRLKVIRKIIKKKQILKMLIRTVLKDLKGN